MAVTVNAGYFQTQARMFALNKMAATGDVIIARRCEECGKRIPSLARDEVTCCSRPCRDRSLRRKRKAAQL